MRAASDPEAALRNAGVLLRAAVTGLRGLLIARGSVTQHGRDFFDHADLCQALIAQEQDALGAKTDEQRRQTHGSADGAMHAGACPEFKITG